jgi:phage recombination protein Bet
MTEEKKTKAVVPKNSAAAVWADNQLDMLRKNLFPHLNNQEFVLLVGMGRRFKADPYKRQIWAVKYSKDEPAAIFLARDWYRKEAQRDKAYNGHFVDAVYTGDEFEVEDGIVHHHWNLKDRGELAGAYCVTYRKGIDRPFFVYCDFKEYNKAQSTWRKLPITMMKKVPESQCLRMAFQERFEGTYDESEQIFIDTSHKEALPSFENMPPLPPAPELQQEKEPVNPPIEITTAEKAAIQTEFIRKYGDSKKAFAKLQELLPGITIFNEIKTVDQMQALRDDINTSM